MTTMGKHRGMSELQAEHTPAAVARRLAADPHQSYLRDFLFGAIDGSITTFAIVSGVVGAELSSSVVLILGFANLLADGFSMGVSNFLGTKADRQIVQHADAMEPSELLELDVANLLARIHGDRPVRLYRGENWRFLCGCSRAKVTEVLRAFGSEDLESLIEERERVSVNCEFCNAEFVFDAIDVTQLFVEDQHDLQPTRH